MNNKEFLTEMSKKMSTGSSSAFTPAMCQKMVAEFTECLVGALESDNEVIVAGLGSFEIKKKNERIIVNPTTGKKMLVPPKLAINFKMSNTLKNKINVFVKPEDQSELAHYGSARKRTDKNVFVKPEDQSELAHYDSERKRTD